jgi:hypothetical protein
LNYELNEFDSILAITEEIISDLEDKTAKNIQNKPRKTKE